MYKIGQELVCKYDYTPYGPSHPKLNQNVVVDGFEWEGKECGLFLIGFNVIAYGERISYPIDDFEPVSYNKCAISEVLEKFKPIEKETDVQVKEIELMQP